MFALNLSVLSDMVSASAKFSRALYLDVVTVDGTSSIVLRGEDKAIVGSNKGGKESPACVWNDETGEYHVFTLADCDDEARANAIVNEVLAFYTSLDSFGKRLEAMSDDSRSLLPLLLPIFGHGGANDEGVSVMKSKRVMRFADRNAKNAEREKVAREKLARDALKLLGSLKSMPSTTPANGQPSLESILAQFLAGAQSQV